MNYFRFEIPTNADGTRVSYSPNYHGTMPRCPKGVVVDLYNDKEGWGIAHTADTFKPQEVTAIMEDEAKNIVAAAKDEDGVFFGQKLADRWLPEAIPEPAPPEAILIEQTEDSAVVDVIFAFCPICHKRVVVILKKKDGTIKVVQEGVTVISGVVTVNLILTCPDGHKVRVKLNGR